MTKLIVTFFLLLLSFSCLHGKEPDGSRVFPLVELRENGISNFLRDIIIPLAKMNHYDPMSDTICLETDNTDKDYKVRIIVDICFDLYPVYDKDNIYYLAKIDNVLIFLRGNAVHEFYGERLGNIRVYSKPLSLAVCDDEAQWTFVIEEGSMKLISFEDWGLSWLEGVPREFYDPGFIPVKKLEPNIPKIIYSRLISEEAVRLPIHQ